MMRHRSWPRVIASLGRKCLRSVTGPLPVNVEQIPARSVVYGAFKGMGDLLCAAPVIGSELAVGAEVTLLLFPQLRAFADLVDFGPRRNHLRVVVLPTPLTGKRLRAFFLEMSRISPDLVWYSPHSPLTVSSWRIPLLLATTRLRYWPKAKLAGAASERLSWLFDVRLPVDRQLPYMLREWTAYSMLRSACATTRPPRARFVESIQAARKEAVAYDLLIHPGAGTKNRQWPHDKYAQLLDLLPTCRVAIAGLPSDIEDMRRALSRHHGITFVSGSLEQVILSIAKARLALTMDSGTMYFARLLDVPTIALFGPSDPATVIEPEADLIRMYERRWPCQPCAKTRCVQPQLYCMRSIEPRSVAAEISRRLATV